MLQSDRQASGDRGQIELFGETQFWTFDDKCHASLGTCREPLLQASSYVTKSSHILLFTALRIGLACGTLPFHFSPTAACRTSNRTLILWIDHG
jgi:hypothetical protein